MIDGYSICETLHSHGLLKHFKLHPYQSVIEVSRSDFMGLGLVSVSSFKGLGLVSVSLETTLSRPQDLKGEKRKIEAWKKHSVDGRFQYPQWKNDVFHVEKYSQWKNYVFLLEKYLTRKILGLGLGLDLGF